MKRYKRKFKEEITTEENEIFKLQNPNIKPKWISINNDIIQNINRWYVNNNHPMDIKSITFWMNKDINEFPPIILHIYNKKINIIDGWHRLYAAIQNNNKKILAYIK